MSNPFDVLGNMGALQNKFMAMKEQIEKTTATGSAGAGMVQVTLNSVGKVFDVKIDPTVIDPNNPHTLEVLIASACNDGVQKVQELLKQNNQDFMAGFNS